MKKSQMVLKPLAIAVAVASGSFAMQAIALPALPASKMLTESICHATVDVEIAAGQRDVTTANGFCQERSLPVTKGLVLVEGSASVAGTSQQISNVSGELYQTTAAGRQGSLLLTPNRALSVASEVSYSTKQSDPSLAFDLAAAVQPASGLTDADISGTYHIAMRNSAFSMVAAGLEGSAYARPNFALGFFNNYATAVDIQFNGDGTCQIVGVDDRANVTLRKDPLLTYDAAGEPENEFPNGLGQVDGANYGMHAAISPGIHGLGAPEHNMLGWEGQSCSYSLNGDKVALTYGVDPLDFNGQPDGNMEKVISIDLYVSADKRYLVTDGTKSTGSFFGFTVGLAELPSGMAVGFRTDGSADVAGKTYLFNALEGLSNLSTGFDPAYEVQYNPDVQTEQCISRGSLTFNADGSCQLASVSSCGSRFFSGYEEKTDGAGNGTIVDRYEVAQVSDEAATCSWSENGGVVSLTATQRGESVDYLAQVSDNGEALLALGGYGTYAPVLDADNDPLLPMHAVNKSIYLVGQQAAAAVTPADLAALAVTNDVATSSAAFRGDFTGDGKADLLLRNASGKTQVWEMDGVSMVSRRDYGFTDADASVAAIHDFDSNGYSDVLLRSANGALSVMTVDDNGRSAFNLLGHVAAGVVVEGLADIDGDGNKDIVLKNAAGHVSVMRMNGAQRAAGGMVPFGFVQPTTRVAMIADIDGNGTDDVVFQGSSGSIFVNYSSAGQLDRQTTVQYNVTMKAKAVVDYNGDGEKDVVVLNEGTGRLAVIVTNAGVRTSTVELGTYAGAEFLAAGDFNGDGNADIVLKSASDELVTILFDGAGNSAVESVGNVPAGFEFVGAVDLNGDGQDDLVFDDAQNMQHFVVLVDNGQQQAASTLSKLSRVNTTYTAK